MLVDSSVSGQMASATRKPRVQETQVINGSQVVKQLRKTCEHQVYTAEPGGEYLCHSEIGHGNGTGLGLARDMYEVMLENNSIDTLEAVVMDGTSVNTGARTGLIAHLERMTRKNLLWLICKLHGNELDFRHLFTHCDGGNGTSGPDSFKGPLGQECCQDDIHVGDIVQFQPVPSRVQ